MLIFSIKSFWYLSLLSIHHGPSLTLISTQTLSCVQLFAIPWTITYQAPLSMVFSRQEYWSGLPNPLPGDIPDPGVKPPSLHLQLWHTDSSPLARKPLTFDQHCCNSFLSYCPAMLHPPFHPSHNCYGNLKPNLTLSFFCLKSFNDCP